MLGQQEVVVRPLEDPLVKVAGISGTTDLGDGRPTLVLDLAALGGRLLGESTSTEVVGVSDLHVLFKVADAEYVLPAADVLQMESFAGATKVPGAASDVAGLVQIRGRVVPVRRPAGAASACPPSRPRSTRASWSCSRASARSGCSSTARARC